MLSPEIYRLSTAVHLLQRFCIGGGERDGRESPVGGVEDSDDDAAASAGGSGRATNRDEEATLAKNRHDKRRLNLALTNFAKEGHKSFKFLQV